MASLIKSFYQLNKSQKIQALKISPGCKATDLFVVDTETGKVTGKR